MDEREELLRKNIQEFYTEGKNAFKRKAFNSATSLFFKALAVLADWFILKREGAIPKSHSERFRILQQKHPEIYDVLDKDFPVYQDSYTINISKETAEALEEDVKKIAKETGFELG